MSEEGIIKDRFEKVRKRLRNDSSDDDSEEETKKAKGCQFEAMKKKMEKKMKSKLKAEKGGGGGEKEKKDVEQYSMYSKRWRSEGQRKKAMEREEERWMQNLMKDSMNTSRSRRRSRSEERISHYSRDEDWRRSRRRESSSEDYRGQRRRSRSPAENFSLASILKAELSHKEQVKKEAERMKKEAIVMGAKALKSILERKNS